MLGFNKKILLSNVFSEISEAAFGAANLSVGTAWLGALAYTFQIFFDFSGYSDMAIGLGEVFGFHFMENFNYPYISQTITEFWRRWHISLGTWFRDYIYFPMGGSRVDSKGKLIRNLLVVWCLTGIWHGANWTFLLWGLLYGVIIIFEKLTNIPKRMGSFPVIFRILYRIFTLVMVIFGWVLFNSADLPHALSYLRSMLSFGSGNLVDRDVLYFLIEYRIVWLVGIVASTPLISYVKKSIIERHSGLEAGLDAMGGFIQFLLFVASVSCLVMNAHNPFIYFNF